MMVALKSKYTYNVYTIIALSLECLRHTCWDSIHSTRPTSSLFNLDHIGSFCLFLSRNCRTWFLDVSSFILCFSITGQKFHWGTYLWGSKFNYLLVKLTYVLCRPLFLYYFSTFPVGILSLDETGGSGILPTGILFKKVYKIHLTSPIKVSKGSDRCIHGLFDDLFKELKWEPR